MEKNIVQSDFKKSSPVDGTIQIRNRGNYVGLCMGGCILIVCGASRGPLD